jgi:hypothetical protein
MRSAENSRRRRKLEVRIMKEEGAEKDEGGIKK